MKESNQKEKLKVQVWLWSRDPKSQEALVLLLKMRSDRGGFWQPVTGSVEPEDQDLEAAALRELREETSIEPLRPPQALGFEFTFQSRWGGTCRESVFQAEAPWGTQGPPTVKIDPAEHIDFKWMAAQDARKLLNFESNIQPLEILKKTRLEAEPRKPRDIASGLKNWLKNSGSTVLVSLFLSATAVASQEGIVTVESAQVRDKPRLNAQVLSALASGQRVRVSDQSVRDLSGGSWYRIQLADGRFGYIALRDLSLDESQRIQVARGIDPDAGEGGADPEGSGWAFSLRGMGLGGIDSNVLQPVVAFEGELTSILQFGERGYARRHYSLGAAYLSYDESKFAMLSFVTRIFSESRSEPEVRIRAGMETSTGSLAAGLNLGYRRPFSLVAGAHVSGYVEGSGICVLLDGGKNPTAVGTLGVGLGFHF